MITIRWQGSAWLRQGENGNGVIAIDARPVYPDGDEVYVLVFTHDMVNWLRREAEGPAEMLRFILSGGATADTQQSRLIAAVQYDTIKRLLDHMGATTNQIEDWKR